MRRSIIILGLIALCGATSPMPALAESHRLQNEFTFRRVGVPQAGATNRITVQVAPRAPSGPSAPGAAGSAGAASGVRGVWRAAHHLGLRPFSITSKTPQAHPPPP